MDNAFKLVKDAYMNDNLYDLLSGKSSIVVSEYASVPTDSEYLFNGWISFIERNEKDKDMLWKKFVDVVCRISNDIDLSWFSIMYLYSFLEYDKQKDISVINKQMFIDTLIFNISKYKDKLKMDKRWIGGNMDKNGLWEYFQRRMELLSSKYQYDFHLKDLNM